jgi:hypothetical protein
MDCVSLQNYFRCVSNAAKHPGLPAIPLCLRDLPSQPSKNHTAAQIKFNNQNTLGFQAWKPDVFGRAEAVSGTGSVAFCGSGSRFAKNRAGLVANEDTFMPNPVILSLP